MAEYNSIVTPNIYPNLNDQQQFRLNKINENKDYFVAEIKEGELISKRLSKYIASFDYIDKSLIIFSATFLFHYLQLLLEHLWEWQGLVLVLHFQYLQEL